MTLEGRERAMRGFLQAAVAAPGAAGAACLIASFAFSVSEVAAGEHLGPLVALATPCPGCALCGMSRAFAALSHGSVAEAWAYNAGVVVAWPVCWALLALSIFALARVRRDPPRFFASQESATHVQ